VDTATIFKLINLNRQFYQSFAQQFSTTRARLQPGVLAILEQTPRHADILDLGCGNGELARQLASRAHSGIYHGLDFSTELVNLARAKITTPLQATFNVADLTSGDWQDQLSAQEFDIVFAFAVLHHIPSNQLRRDVLHKAREHLKSGGRLFLSSWQFLDSPRLQARLQPWESVGLSESDVDPGDYLLDWRHGGYALRYVHHFSKEELEILAQETGFQTRETFHSDGEGGILGLYQYWDPL
jgi:2-polyprenyl-3-methyl-5-hydroxy-6-metoxy-1,4-benzoquinol methylase